MRAVAPETLADSLSRWAFDDDLAFKKHHAGHVHDPDLMAQARSRQLALYNKFLDTVDERQRRYSPIFVSSSGIHYGESKVRAGPL